MLPLARIPVALAVICGLAAVPSPARAAHYPLSIPAPAKGDPSVLATGDSGASIVAWSTNDVYEGFGPLTVDTVLPGPGANRRRWSVGHSLLAGSARDRTGNLDLLTLRNAGSANHERLRLVLYRARQGGGVQRVWSGPGSREAAVARRGDRLAIAWIQYVSGTGTRPARPVLWLVTRRGSGRFTRARAVAGVLPAWLSSTDPSFVNDLALALDGEGNPVVSLTAFRHDAPALVLATLTPGGRVRARQVAAGVDGLVDAQTTRAGRVAVIVEDTGIEGETGECVADHEPRAIWATVREDGATRFGPVRQLDSGPYSCADSPARLVTNDGERPTVLWGSAAGAPQTPPTVKLALASAGDGFGAPTTIATGALLQAATYHDGGMLLVATTRPTDPDNPYGGPLDLQAITSGSGVGPLEPVDAAGAGSVLADTNTNGTDSVLAWLSSGGGRTLRLTGFGGQ